MVLKIEEERNGSNAVLSLSGRISSGGVQQIKAYMDTIDGPFALDLDEVHLVDLDAARFLAVCEKRGIELLNCRPHVREWICLETPSVTDLE